MSEQQHNKILNDVMDRFDEMFESSSKVLENRIAERILSTKTVDELLELRVAIDEDFRALIYPKIKDFMPELDAVARDTIANTPQDVSPQDNRVAAELKAQSYQRLEESVNTAKAKINSEIVVGALGGYALATTAQNARHAVNGFFITVDNVEITRLQNKIKKLRLAEGQATDEINRLMGQLRNKFQNVSVGGGMYLRYGVMVL